MPQIVVLFNDETPDRSQISAACNFLLLGNAELQNRAIVSEGKTLRYHFPSSCCSSPYSNHVDSVPYKLKVRVQRAISKLLRRRNCASASGTKKTK